MSTAVRTTLIEAVIKVVERGRFTNELWAEFGAAATAASLSENVSTTESKEFRALRLEAVRVASHSRREQWSVVHLSTVLGPVLGKTTPVGRLVPKSDLAQLVA
ncbi:MAG: hypothetical protein ACOYON_05400 [Fimbriimonas sp.]